jgi:hypothetical protein
MCICVLPKKAMKKERGTKKGHTATTSEKVFFWTVPCDVRVICMLDRTFGYSIHDRRSVEWWVLEGIFTT